MPYQAVYINPLVQFGAVNLTLVLSNTEGIMPNVRVDKKFRYPEQVTAEGLAAEAQKIIDWAVAEYEKSLLPPEEAIIP